MPAPRASIPGQNGQGQTHRGEKVHPHDRFHLGWLQSRHHPALRYRRVVHEHIDPVESIPGLLRQRADGCACRRGRPPHIVESGECFPAIPPAPRRGGRDDGRSTRQTAPSLAIARASAAPTPDEAPVISTRCPAAENATAQGWPRTSTFGAEWSEFATTGRRSSSSQPLHSICTDSLDLDTCHAFAGWLIRLRRSQRDRSASESDHWRGGADLRCSRAVSAGVGIRRQQLHRRMRRRDIGTASLGDSADDRRSPRCPFRSLRSRWR